MAKLPAAKAKEAADTADDWEGGGAVEPGVYLCKLREVDCTKSGAAGPYWAWTFEVVGAAKEPSGKRFWDNTSLSERAIGRLGKHFAAFGVGTDTDTEDLIGKVVAVEVNRTTQKGGQNDGQLKNDVVALHPADVHAHYEDWAASTGAAGPSADDY
jgi:hypothetical protein